MSDTAEQDDKKSPTAWEEIAPHPERVPPLNLDPYSTWWWTAKLILWMILMIVVGAAIFDLMRLAGFQAYRFYTVTVAVTLASWPVFLFADLVMNLIAYMLSRWLILLLILVMLFGVPAYLANRIFEFR
jgi:hypothetical protein